MGIGDIGVGRLLWWAALLLLTWPGVASAAPAKLPGFGDLGYQVLQDVFFAGTASLRVPGSVGASAGANVSGASVAAAVKTQALAVDLQHGGGPEDSQADAAAEGGATLPWQEAGGGGGGAESGGAGGAGVAGVGGGAVGEDERRDLMGEGNGALSNDEAGGEPLMDNREDATSQDISEVAGGPKHVANRGRMGAGGGQGKGRALRVPWQRFSPLRLAALDRARSASRATSTLSQEVTVANGWSSNSGLALSINGIDAWSARAAGSKPQYNGTNNFPPQPAPGGCVGSGFVVQLVNRAIAVFNATTGKLLLGAVPTNQFFGLPPYMSDGKTGDNVLQASCVYDPRTRQFYLSALWLSSGGVSPLDLFGQTRRGTINFGSGLLVAVSRLNDPGSSWRVYFVPTTNDGWRSRNDAAPPLGMANPPFFGDYPQLGIDYNGVYITTSQFGFGNNFVGYNVFCLGKGRLQLAANFKGQRFMIPSRDLPLAFGNIAPVRTPMDAAYPFEAARRGTMYFAANSITGTSLALFAIFNTSLLNAAAPPPDRELPGVYSLIQVPQQALTDSLGAVQKQGPLPYGSTKGYAFAPRISTNADGAVLSSVSGAVQFGFGGGWQQSTTATIWLAWTVAVNGATGAAVAQFKPKWSSSPRARWGFKLGSQLKQFKLVEAATANLLYPSIIFNRRGAGIVAFSLAGPTYFPSCGFVRISPRGALGANLFLAAVGRAPLDGTGFYPGPARFGDVQSAAVDEQGAAWAFAEFVSARKQTLWLDPLGGWTNWATAAFQVRL